MMNMTTPGSRIVSTAAEKAIGLELKYGALNYKPLPVVLARGLGVHVYDVDDNKYLDMLSAYSAVNQGHCHPRLVAALQTQAQQLTLTSRAFHNNRLGRYEQFMCERFGYDRLLPMNSGVEACDTAVKLARRWAYDVKGVPADKARVVFAKNNFWGRSIAAISASTDPTCRDGFGPFLPGFDLVDYDDLTSLTKALEDPNVAAFMVEPIQGEAGVVVPSPGYLSEVSALCKAKNVLLIADEVQTGLGRTGKMLCSSHDDIRPDIVVLGKALSGGMLPISAVLADDEIMLTIQAGEHGSTYGGNPLAAAIAMEAVSILDDEGMVQNSAEMGQLLLDGLRSIESDTIVAARGKGLMTALVLDLPSSKTAFDLCLLMMGKGLLAKQTHTNTIRLAPPLTINRAQVEESVDIIATALKQY